MNQVNVWDSTNQLVEHTSANRTQVDLIAGDLPGEAPHEFAHVMGVKDEHARGGAEDPAHPQSDLIAKNNMMAVHGGVEIEEYQVDQILSSPYVHVTKQ